MRALALMMLTTLVGVFASFATGANELRLVRVAKPAFPPPLAEVTPSGPVRLSVVSTVSRFPGSGLRTREPGIPVATLPVDVSPAAGSFGAVPRSSQTQTTSWSSAG